MIIDTHCHYNMEPLTGEWRRHWQKAQEHGVTHSVIVGTGLDTSQRGIELAEQELNLVVAPGVHPYRYEEAVSVKHLSEVEVLAQVESDLAELNQLIPTTTKVVALGETGLDYFRLPDSPTDQDLVRQAQRQAFIGHIKLANQYQLPLIIHVRDKQVSEQPTPENAYWDTLDILQTQRPSQPFILHCVSGPLAYVSAALNLGAYVGVAANVTYKNADHIRSLVRTTPVERLLLETDAPFLPPQQYRGQVCEPWMISLTEAFLAEEMGISTEKLYDNACQLFKLI